MAGEWQLCSAGNEGMTETKGLGGWVCEDERGGYLLAAEAEVKKKVAEGMMEEGLRDQGMNNSNGRRRN